jgi:hypothetical protein
MLKLPFDGLGKTVVEVLTEVLLIDALAIVTQSEVSVQPDNVTATL